MRKEGRRLKRFGQIIKLLPEKRELYRQLHANPWKAVGEQIARSNLHNYSIYLAGDYLFAYFEYTGDDFELDMKKMAEDPATQLWWSLTNPCQAPWELAKEGDWWSNLEEVFHQD